MPSLRATACAVVRLSPVSITMRMPSALSACSAAAVVALIGSAIAITPAALPSTATKIAVAPSRRSSSARASSGAVAMFSSARNFALPSATRRRSTRPIAPLPVGELKPITLASAMPRSLRGINDRAGERMLARLLDARRKAQQFGLGDAFGHDGDDFRLAFGERAGLVDHQRVDLLHALERLGVLDQHAGLRAAPDADHDRHRRRKAERARAGDDQHRDGRDQRIGEARLRAEDRPCREGDQRDRDHQRHEPGRHLIGEALDRRARALRGRDHLDDLRQHGVAADLLGAHQEAAGGVERAGDDLRAGLLGDRHRLAGDQRLVERRAALGHHAVDRHLVARTHAQDVADRDRVERDLFFLPVGRTRRAVFGARSISARIAPEVCSRARSSSTWPSSTSTVMTAAASK